MMAGVFSLVDHFAVAYLIATSDAMTIGSSPSLHAPSGRTATAENRAVPVAIIARVMVARQGRTGPRSSFRGPTLPVLGPGHHPGRFGRLIRLPGWERVQIVPCAWGGFQPPARRVGRGGSAVNPIGGLRPGRFGSVLRRTGWNNPGNGRHRLWYETWNDRMDGLPVASGNRAKVLMGLKVGAIVIRRVLRKISLKPVGFILRVGPVVNV
jgi:hypothetical protein